MLWASPTMVGGPKLTSQLPRIEFRKTSVARVPPASTSLARFAQTVALKKLTVAGALTCTPPPPESLDEDAVFPLIVLLRIADSPPTAIPPPLAVAGAGGGG